MTDHQISPQAVKTAWKMVRTIFPHYSISLQEGSLLLTLVTALALDDLTQGGSLELREKFSRSSVLALGTAGVEIRTDPQARTVLKGKYSGRELEHALEQAEGILDAHELPEDERDALFTALPCLGLHALSRFVRWNEAPPFFEVG